MDILILATILAIHGFTHWAHVTFATEMDEAEQQAFGF